MMMSPLFQGSRKAILTRACLIIAVVALVDWRVETYISFGFLYLFPMLMVGGCLRRWQTALLALLCVGLAEEFDAVQWTQAAGIPRMILMFAAYFGSGLFAHELARNRHLAAQHLNDIEREVELRREAENQLQALIASSPAAIITLDASANVLLANDAAHRLFGLPAGALPGKPIATYLPTLAAVPALKHAVNPLRAVMQCHGRRADGGVFLAGIWFSTYSTRSGPRLAAVVADASEDLRDREESGLQHLLAGSRVLMGAVFHEIRNMCGAISVVRANLAGHAGLTDSEDFRTLGALVEGLERLASAELRQSAGDELEAVDLGRILEDLRIVVEPALAEEDIAIRWDVPANLPRVWGDRQSILQIFLNLAKNSRRAMATSALRELTISVTPPASPSGQTVLVRFRDTGPGVANPERLFQPFQRGAEAVGLGLYLSKAFARASLGDLRHQPEPSGCCFVLELMVAGQGAGRRRSTENEQSSNPSGGRSRAVSGEPQPASRSRV